jgi:hypothetical protein
MTLPVAQPITDNISSHLCQRSQRPCGLITSSGESYCVCVCVCVCNCVRSRNLNMRRPTSDLGCCAHRKQKELADVLIHLKLYYSNTSYYASSALAYLHSLNRKWTHLSLWNCFVRLFQTYWNEWICGNKMPTRCNRWFLLQILLLAQHVSGTTMPIIGSSRGDCCLWCLVLWFSSCRYGVELKVMCPVCGLLQLPETRWASNKICNKNHLLHLVGILFPHINDDARSKSHQILKWAVIISKCCVPNQTSQWIKPFGLHTKKSDKTSADTQLWY